MSMCRCGEILVLSIGFILRGVCEAMVRGSFQAAGARRGRPAERVALTPIGRDTTFRCRTVGPESVRRHDGEVLVAGIE